jgi:FKBP-type peptidyl-prolyl cis-trans isomerase FklB
MRMVFLLVAGALLLPALGLAAEEARLDDPPSRLSYSLGHQIGEDLKRQGTEVRPDALESGLRDGLSGIAPGVDPQQMRQILAELKNKVVVDQRKQKQKAVEGYRGEGREFLAANAEKEGVVSLPSGLQYQVLAEGSGRRPGPDDTVTVHYRGTTLDGAVFYDSHRGEGHPASFHVGAVIRGMSEALQLMREGDTWRLFVPADLAYGERGPLADRALIFEVELVSVQPGTDPQAGLIP